MSLTFLDNKLIAKALGILPRSPEFSIVEKTLEMQRQQAMLKKAIMISYPIISNRYLTTIAGNTNINFKQGKVKLPAGAPNTELDLQGQLDKVRSLIIYCCDADAILKLDGKRIINDHTLWHMFQDIDIEQLDIEFLTSTNIAPNQFAFGFVASDKPKHSFQNSLFLAHDIRTSDIIVTTDANVVTMLRHLAGFDTVVLTTKNTDSTNSLDLTVEYSADSITWYPVSGYTAKAIASGVTDELDITVKYHFLRVQVKATVGAAQADLEQIIQISR